MFRLKSMFQTINCSTVMVFNALDIALSSMTLKLLKMKLISVLNLAIIILTIGHNINEVIGL